MNVVSYSTWAKLPIPWAIYCARCHKTFHPYNACNVWDELESAGWKWGTFWFCPACQKQQPQFKPPATKQQILQARLDAMEDV